MTTISERPHRGEPLLGAGPSPAVAPLTLLLFHGRGGSARDALALGAALAGAERELALLAPQASGNSWYPQRFLAPLDHNQPWLDAALDRGAALLDELADTGVPHDRIALVGFSQGACLASELATRDARRFAALLLYTGGLIGPVLEPERYRGDFAGTPVLLSSGDPDPHVPWSRVEATAALLRERGAAVELHRWPGRAHTITEQEIVLGRRLLADAAIRPRELEERGRP